jgi:hypothetical protein
VLMLSRPLRSDPFPLPLLLCIKQIASKFAVFTRSTPARQRMEASWGQPPLSTLIHPVCLSASSLLLKTSNCHQRIIGARQASSLRAFTWQRNVTCSCCSARASGGSATHTKDSGYCALTEPQVVGLPAIAGVRFKQRVADWCRICIRAVKRAPER